MGLHVRTGTGLSLTPGQIKHMWSMREHPAVAHEWVRGRWVCALCGKPIKRRLWFGRWVHGAMGQRLTPGCVCGWYSPDGSHWRFERHMRRTKERTDG